jgi:hypothetical protein
MQGGLRSSYENSLKKCVPLLEGITLKGLVRSQFFAFTGGAAGVHDVELPTAEGLYADWMLRAK